jgi:hypothetical protein
MIVLYDLPYFAENTTTANTDRDMLHLFVYPQTDGIDFFYNKTN